MSTVEKELKELKELINAISKAAEDNLNIFQRDLVVWQRQFNTCWNLLNVLIKVMEKKSLLSDKDVIEAVTELQRSAEVGPAVGMANLVLETVSGRQ